MVLAQDITQPRTQDVKISEDVTFATMLLTSDTLQGLRNSGFYKPSPVQLHGIPMGKCGFDLMLEAKSGTGKTAVFTVIALEKLDISKGLQVVILAPTREIASQICDVITQIGVYYEALNAEVVMGGLPVQEDILKFKKHVHIVVGSPGRLRHLIQDNYIDISAVRLLVLDEADKLMEKSFQSDINYIFSVLPKQKQVIMSSATYPEVSKTFINKYVHNAQHICPDNSNILLGIEQRVITIKYNSNIVRQTQYRFEELLKILSKKQFKQCLIFCNYQARIGELHKMLTREKWPAEQLYGQQEQSDRLDALKTLQEYKCRILISTDLAARGIDASNVDLVVNFEPPFEWQTYLHRIGRAGRYGAYGIAITILSEGKEENKFKEVLKSISISLDLRNLWSDSLFCIQNETKLNSTAIITQTPTASKPKENKKYKELWDTLTLKSCEDCANEILSFENLCESFDNSKECHIESFSDLLGSFFNHGETSNISKVYPYKNMNINKINIDDHNESILNQECISKTNKLYNLSEVQTEIISVENSITAENEQSMSVLNMNIKSDCDIASFTENNMKSENNYLNQNNIDEAMLAAGLPTCFSSSKYKTKRNNYVNTRISENDNKKSYQCNNENKVSNDDKIRKINKLSSVSVREKNSRKANSGARNTNQYGSGYDMPITEYDKQFSEVHNEPSYSKTNDSQNYLRTIHDKTIRPPYSDKQKQDKSKCNYIQWYNQFKNHMKGVEYAMYIEEISKI